jgi:signal peptidase I
LLRAAILGRDWRVTILRAAIWGIIIVVVWEFILTPIRVSGISMLPTYHDREINVINHLAYLWHPPQRGDVVAVRVNPNGKSGEFKKLPDVMYFKRIIGLPGETVAWADGHVLIDGKILDEPYETGHCDWNIPPEKLGPDQYYVVGDNREMPEELHQKGAVHRSQIVGKAML